jgi:hypothetical protein
MDAKEMEEAFLTGNAPERIAEALAEVLRDLMRATAARANPTDAIIRATGNWKYLIEHLKRWKQPLSWQRIFEDAVKILRREEVQGERVDRCPIMSSAATEVLPPKNGASL